METTQKQQTIEEANKEAIRVRLCLLIMNLQVDSKKYQRKFHVSVQRTPIPNIYWSVHPDRVSYLFRQMKIFVGGFYLENKKRISLIFIIPHIPPPVNTCIVPPCRFFPLIYFIYSPTFHKMHDFTLDELSQYFHLPINDVARDLGVCATVLKKICRKNGIKRWPHRKIKSIDKMISTLESVQVSSVEEQERIEDEIRELKMKREFLLKNPNVSYKSVISKNTINSCTSKPQNKLPSTTLSKMDITKVNPMKTSSTTTFSISSSSSSSCRSLLINSQDEVAVRTLFNLSRESEPSEKKDDSQIFVDFLFHLFDKNAEQTSIITPINVIN